MSNTIADFLDEMYDENSDKTSLGEVIERFDDRGGPLLLAPALVALLPTGATPGVPTICGITMFFIVYI